MTAQPALAGLEHALDTIMERCLAVREEESVLVVGDHGSHELSAAMAEAADRRGAEVTRTVIDLPGRRGNEPPAPVAAAMAASDVFVAPTTHGSLSHTEARRRATAAGARGATLPGATADMLARLMSADFGALKARCTQLAALLGRAASAHFACRNGSDMVFDLTERQGRAEYGVLTATHAFGNLPAGEGFISPRTGEGVVAAVSGPPGLMDEPMRLTIDAGRLVDAGGPHGSGVMEMLLKHGPLGLNLAELGVGANDAARVTGNVLEDEKALGTLHVAFGSSAGIGGTVSVPVHRDFVVVEPTLDIGRTRVLDAGRWVL